MSNNLRGYLELEHRDDYTYLTLHGREFIVTGLREDFGSLSGPTFGYRGDDRLALKLDLWYAPQPAKPRHRPVKRSWARSMGLRKAVA